MIELSNTNKQYQEIKDELVLEIAEIDMKLEEIQKKNRHLKQDGGSPYQFEE